MSTPDLTQRFLPYFIWFLIVVLNNYFFSVFSKKTKSTLKILIAVFLSSSVQAGNDYQKEKQFQRLNKITDERKKVNILNIFQFFIIYYF